MIDVRTAEFIHNKSVEEFGGLKGIRDFSLLDAALHRPFATFDSIDLYPTAIDKAAALLESIVINHPFFDGNKRTWYMLMKYLLFKSGVFINATMEERYQMVVDASTGSLGFDGIKASLEEHTKPLQKI